MSIISGPGRKRLKQAVMVAAGGGIVALATAVGVDTWLRAEYSGGRSSPLRVTPSARVARPERATPEVARDITPQPLMVFVVETDDEATFVRHDLERANSVRVAEQPLTFLVAVRAAAGSAELLDALGRDAHIAHGHGQAAVVLNFSTRP